VPGQGGTFLAVEAHEWRTKETLPHCAADLWEVRVEEGDISRVGGGRQEGERSRGRRRLRDSVYLHRRSRGQRVG
jgi:hypothetical protein